MSFKRGIIYPANPIATRGSATKLSSSGSKLVYANGRTIIIRDLLDPAKNIVYTGHVQPTTVARISPSGYYCASADSTGTVRIWDIVGEDNVLKLETKPFAGPVNDIAWDGESKRIIAVGNGRERSGHVFMFDTGSSAGEISGHSKMINAVSIRAQRPFRAVTASDDTKINFYHGAPYKYEKGIQTHTKFVQDVRYAPSGDLFVSVGSDAKVFLYDGNTGDMTVDFGENVHKGTIFAASWSPDSRFFSTSSADKTVNYYDAAASKVVASWTVGNGISDQQAGNTWLGEHEIASLSLNGDVNIFDTRSGKVERVLYGPTRSVTASAIDSSGTLYTGSFDGRIVSVTGNGTVESVTGSGHTNHVSGIATTASKMCSVGYDDTFREFSSTGFAATSLSTSGQPKGIATVEGGLVFIATVSTIEALSGGKKVSALQASYSPQSIAAYGNNVAVGGQDEKVYLYSWDGSKLVETGKLESNRGAVSSVAFSPDGSLLAAGDSAGKLMLYKVADKSLVTSRWAGHSGRINTLAFHPGGKHVASGSLDTNVFVWSVDKPLRKLTIPNACMGGVNVVEWIGENTIASAGADASIRTWEIVLPA